MASYRHGHDRDNGDEQHHGITDSLYGQHCAQRLSKDIETYDHRSAGVGVLPRCRLAGGLVRDPYRAVGTEIDEHGRQGQVAHGNPRQRHPMDRLVVWNERLTLVAAHDKGKSSRASAGLPTRPPWSLGQRHEH